MPNWCEGTFKARGPKENLVRFIKNLLQNYNYTTGEEETTFELQADCNGRMISSVYVPNTNRVFFDLSRGYIDLHEDYTGIEFQFACIAKAGWSFKADELCKIAQEYLIDIRVDGYECGLEFEQHIEVARTGLIKTDSVVSYIDYEWECPMPAVDAESVKHGYLKPVAEDTRNQITWWKCSECNYDISFTCNYCPNCGAKMDGWQDKPCDDCQEFDCYGCKYAERKEE